jgi:UPF0755 protein
VTKKTEIIVLVVGSMFLLAFVCIGLFLPDSKILINVKKGDSFPVVAERLKENKLICSRALFLAVVKLTWSQNKLKAGAYKLSKKDSILKILDVLKNSSKNILRFTVPEGNNIKQTADIISKTVNIDKEKFIRIAIDKNLEGYLMPETYFVTPGVSEEQLIEMMHNEFNKKMTSDMYKKAKQMNISFDKIVTMASIIEKEAVKSEVKSTIASVFYNRLKKNMRLQSDVTVLYAIGTNKTNLTIEDTRINSPYNTYMHFGLPPGPITNPGIESIKAALYPKSTKNLFFVSTNDGDYLFAMSFDGHKKNKQLSKRKNKSVADEGIHAT